MSKQITSSHQHFACPQWGKWLRSLTQTLASSNSFPLFYHEWDCGIWRLSPCTKKQQATFCVVIFGRFSTTLVIYLTWFHQAAGLPLATHFCQVLQLKKKKSLPVSSLPSLLFGVGGKMHPQMTNNLPKAHHFSSWHLNIKSFHSFYYDPNQIYHPLLPNYTMRTRKTRQYYKPMS